MTLKSVFHLCSVTGHREYISSIKTSILAIPMQPSRHIQHLQYLLWVLSCLFASLSGYSSVMFLVNLIHIPILQASKVIAPVSSCKQPGHSLISLELSVDPYVRWVNFEMEI
jgi:hypothetical protein